MEITQEHLDRSLNDLFEKIDRRFATQTAELKTHSRQQTEELARIIAETVANPMQERFDKLEEMTDTKQKVHDLETFVVRNFKKLEEALHISLLEKA